MQVGSAGGTNSLRKLRRDWWKTRLCTSCVSPLGRIISRGGICPQCGLRVCKNCRCELDSGSGAWVCVLCNTNSEMITENLATGSKSLGRDPRSIRRSWSISNPQRAQTNSPVLKSYTIIHPEESLRPGSSSGIINSGTSSSNHPSSNAHRQFHSLPRMSTESDRSKKIKRSFDSEFEKEKIKRHRSFQTTLHPYQVPNPPSPSASINFIEDPFWDYYDYDIEQSPSGSLKTAVGRILRLSQRRNSIRNRHHEQLSEMEKLLNIRAHAQSNRSSCERSLGETFDYDFCLKNNYSNYNSLSDTELNDNSKFEKPSEDQLTPRRFSTESSTNFYRFATITPINMSPLNDPRKDNISNNISTNSPGSLRLRNLQLLNEKRLHQNTPVKPERKSNKNKRSMSLNSYDGKKLFSPLRTYVVLMKENLVPKSNNISNANKNLPAMDPTTDSGDRGNINNQRKNNTSSVLINSSSSSTLHSDVYRGRDMNSTTKFHSLPRERVIRIEREDWRSTKPGRTTIEEPKLNKKSTLVEISRSPLAKDISSSSSFDLRNTTRVPKIGKIERSQSYREISTSKPLHSGFHEVPLSKVRLEKSSPKDHTLSGTETLPIIRTKGDRNDIFNGKSLHQKAFLNPLLDDKESMNVVQNFLKSHQMISPNDTNESAGNVSRTNEKSSTRGVAETGLSSSQMIKDSSKKSDFVQEQINDFEHFQRQQIHTFDNYSSQSSTFPRALHKSTQEKGQKLDDFITSSRRTRLESEPIRKHTSTTTISSDNLNNLKSYDGLDAYFHPSGENPVDKSNNERIVPIVVVNGVKHSSTGPGWSATLPHPYIRKHRQQKSTFLEQTEDAKVPIMSLEKNFISPTISDIEREIERDIYFQKTQSLDRGRSSKDKLKPTSTYFSPSNVELNPNEDKLSTANVPPVASPRLKRKTKLLLQASNPNLSSPKINPEHFSSIEQDYVSSREMGTNYQKSPSFSSSNKNNTSRLPNEPRPTSNIQSEYSITANQQTKSLFDNSLSFGYNEQPIYSQQDQSFSKFHKGSNIDSKLSSIDSKMKNLSSRKSESGFADAERDTLELELSSRPSQSELSLNQNPHHKEQQVKDEESAPIATPRSRRKNSQHGYDSFNNEISFDSQHQQGNDVNKNNINMNQPLNTMEGDTTIIGGVYGTKSQIANPKAVRFEPHVIEINERKHNQSRIDNANSISNAMRMNKNFNNQLQGHLTDSVDDNNVPVISSAQHLAYMKHRGKSHTYYFSTGNPTSKKNHHYSHNHGGVKSFKGSSDNKDNTSKRSHGFVARAIAKVKSKAKGKKSSNSGNVRSIETRDSITYISPPPTHTTEKEIHQGPGLPPVVNIEEIVVLSSSHTDKQNQHANNGNGVSRSESFSSKGILKHDKNLQESSQNKSNLDETFSEALQFSESVFSSSEKLDKSTPQKPKRKPNIKMDPSLSPILNPPIPILPVSRKAEVNGKDNKSKSEDQDETKFLGLDIDQLTPSSSSSSSSSSYMSNLQESYDFFHDSEECESIGGGDEEDVIEDESDQVLGVFKSFDDDEDAGEDFIFYSNQLNEDQNEQRKSKVNHAYNGPAAAIANHNSVSNSSKTRSNVGSGSKFSNLGNANAQIFQHHINNHTEDYHNNKGDILILKNKELKAPATSSTCKTTTAVTKGLAKHQVEDNRKDGKIHHPHNLEEGVVTTPSFNALKDQDIPKQHYLAKETTSLSRLDDLSGKKEYHQNHPYKNKNDKEIQQHANATNNTTKSTLNKVVVPQAILHNNSSSSKNKQWDNSIEIGDPDGDNIRREHSQNVTGFQNQYGTNTAKITKQNLSTTDERIKSNLEFLKKEDKNLPNLLLPSSFIKNNISQTTYQQFNQSEFFPGEFDHTSSGGMSSLYKETSGVPSTQENNNQGKFKSRVVVNPSLEDSASSSASSSEIGGDVISKGIKLPTGGFTSSPNGKKNVTRVEISGDVGIVTNASAFLNSRRAQLKKVNEGLWKNDVYSSGLTQLNNQKQPSHIDSCDDDLEHNSEDNNSVITSDSTTSSSRFQLGSTEGDEENMISSTKDIIGPFDEIRSSVSNNGSGGSSECKIGSSSEEDGSDWHSESTKNTVIFRGIDEIGNGKQFNPLAGFSYNCDPEIHISSITLVDSSVTGSAETLVSPSLGTKPIATLLANNESNSDATKQNINTPPKNKFIDKRVEEEVVHDESLDDKDKDNKEGAKSSLGGDSIKSDSIKSDSKGSQDVSAGTSISSTPSSLIALVDSSEEFARSNETLTDLETEESRFIQIPEESQDFEVEMVQAHEENRKLNNRHVPSNNKSSASFHQRRESPEGQEQEVPTSHPDEKDSGTSSSNVSNKSPSNKKVLGLNEVVIMEEKSSGKKSAEQVISKSKISQNVLSQLNSASSTRSSPDGQDAERSEGDSTTTEPDVDSPTPMIEHFDVTSDDDSWAEEITFEDDDETDINSTRKQPPPPPPLDLTLHTIVEESCEESEAESSSGNFNHQPTTSRQQRRYSNSRQNDNELEKYFNFGIYNNTDTGSQGGRNSLTNDESEFSDTFSESSFSIDDQDLESQQQGSSVGIDPAELASSRLEKYFFNLGLPQSMINPISSINQTADSDSVGSESESDNSVLEKRKKVLKHHRRSADFEDEFGDKVSDEEEDFGFGQDGFDTIKKTSRKVKKSGSEGNLLENFGTNGSNKSFENHLSGSCGVLLSSGPVEHSTTQKEKTQLEPSLSNSGMSSSSKEESSSASPTSPSSSSRKSGKSGEKPVIKVNRSNSFTWSSDEEVNIMMSKLRQLIKNLIKSKTDSNADAITTSGSSSTNNSNLLEVNVASKANKDKDKQLAYLENELIRLMKSENLKNIVEYFSSEESDVDDVYKFIKVVKESGSINNTRLGDDNSDFDLDLDLEDSHLFKNLQTTMQSEDSSQISPKGSPALLAKVMHHIGNRLAVWMKDENLQEEDNNDDNVTLKCAQSVSSDLNEDRFSWKGSFESALAAKRQSVGSTDSISSSDFAQDRSILRSSSLHHLANSSHHLGQVEENKEEEETASSLPRMTNLQLCNSLPRLNQPSNLAISRAHSLVMSEKTEGEPTCPGPIKSARYRPPGFQPGKSKRLDDEGQNSPILSQSTPVLTQDPGNLKFRSDSMGSIFHDAKPHICVKGQVEFGLQYNYKLACLEVRVKQCRDLAAVDTKRNRSDPYVKAYLLPDRSKGGKRKTKIKKNTLNPVFEEILKFPLTLSELQTRTLWLSVWHSDTFGKNEFLGEVLVDLKDRVFDDPYCQLWDLQEQSGQTEDMPRGDVVIALKWQPKTENTGNLSVLVKEAKNLAPVHKNGSPSTFIKCTMLSDKTRKHKTSISRRSYSPIWNQTLTFEEVDNDGIELTLWNHDLLSHHDLLGTIRVDYDNHLWESMLSRHSFWVEGVLRLT